MILFLAFQALVFAAWTVVSFGILFGVLGRALSSNEGLPDPVAQLGAWGGYMRDPTTAFRRWLWVGLFGLLILCAIGTFRLFAFNADAFGILPTG